ncbi:hypothetical protein PG994_005631 [Apiospora phragmitis]|uniref:HTH CENPB-type domain-containing protein n=1 Tax=Apiospora phragmitis TaxID=2905665 RepID=A0ABR1VCT8_9PEZI
MSAAPRKMAAWRPISLKGYCQNRHFSCFLAMPILTPKSAIQHAILAVQASESERTASKTLKVPRATLRDIIRGRPTRTESKESARTLSFAQEEYLKTWAIRQAQLDLTPKHNVFRLFVARLFKPDQRALPLRIHWVKRFIARHPKLKTILATTINF